MDYMGRGLVVAALLTLGSAPAWAQGMSPANRHARNGFFIGFGGNNISMTPFLNGFASSIEDVNVGVGQIGIGITFD